MPWRVGIGPELGRCLSQRAGSGTIPTRYSIFIPAAEDAGPRNVTFDGGLLKVGVYWSLVAESRSLIWWLIKFWLYFNGSGLCSTNIPFKLSGMIDNLYRRQVFTSPIKMPWCVRNGPELGGAGSGTILTLIIGDPQPDRKGDVWVSCYEFKFYSRFNLPVFLCSAIVYCKWI